MKDLRKKKNKLSQPTNREFSKWSVSISINIHQEKFKELS